jgi:predicted dehydrogenase
MNQGIHAVDAMCWLAGDVDSVIAKTDHMLRDIEVEDTANALLQFKNGAMGVLMGTTLSHAEETSREGDYFRFECEKGAIVFSDGKATMYLHKGDSFFSTKTKAVSLDSDKSAEDESSASDPAKVPAHGHCVLVSDLISAITEDRNPYITGDSARIGVDVVLAVYESSRKGEMVRVQHI